MLRNGKPIDIDIDKISGKSNRLSIESIRGGSRDDRAMYLVEKFKKAGCADADTSYYFFVKCFSNLSEDTIWSIYEKSVENPKIKSPIKYFIRSCANLM